MGRSYLRYELKDTFGVIASDANVIFDGTGNRAISGGLESVLVWNLRTGTLVDSLQEADSVSPALKARTEVTVLCRKPDGTSIAAGYSDGSIKIWHLATRTCSLTLNGHKGAISCLQYHPSGTLLVSGSKDTDIILWDLVGESGLFRLRGHTDMVTTVRFLPGGHFLVSSSKDTLLKLWDLSTQHCVETVVGHRTEIWSFDINQEGTRLVAGSASRVLRVYSINLHALEQSDGASVPGIEQRQAIVYIGEIERECTERVAQVEFSTDGKWLACMAEKAIEFFCIYTGIDAKKRKKKRKARHRKKQQAPNVTEESLGQNPSEVPKLHASDEFSTVGTLRASHKIRSFEFSAASTKQILVGLYNNLIEVWNIEPAANSFKAATSLELPGHRSDIRALVLSDDDTLLLSTSADMIKLWNVKSLQCVRTIGSGYGLCAAFVPGNTHVVIGTNEGMLEIFNLSSAACVASVKAHDGAIWAIAITPDMQGMASASADHDIKFWDFELVEADTLPKTKRLGLSPSHTLKMSDDILSIAYSKDGKFLAASLLDNTVKVFFVDTMKFFLSLYGHKLPALSVSMSTDSTLLVSGSADKSVKIWGLDFGDCHRSILAHQDSVTQVQFVPNTHYFFSASKDKTIKYWDADKFENIMTLSAHHGEIWSLAIAKQGTFIVSGSQDRSIRTWQQTDEPLFLEEERENEMDAIFDEALESPLERGFEDKAESSSAGKRTLETIKAGERIAEALELAEQERHKATEYQTSLAEMSIASDKTGEQNAPIMAPPIPNPLLLGKDPSEYLLEIVHSTRPSELEEALLVLPFASALALLAYFDEWIQKEKAVELCCRCVFFLLKIHHHQIVSNSSALSVLRSLQQHTRKQVRKQKDTIGYNKAAMSFVLNQLRQGSYTDFLEVAEKIKEGKQKRKKRKRGSHV